MFVLRDIPCLLIRLLMKPPYIAKTQEDVLQFRKVQEDMRILYHHLISLLSWGGVQKVSGIGERQPAQVMRANVFDLLSYTKARSTERRKQVFFYRLNYLFQDCLNGWIKDYGSWEKYFSTESKN